MAPQPDNAHGHATHDDSYVYAEPEPGLIDMVRFLYQRRVKLVIYFIAIFALGALVFLLVYFSAALNIEGIIGLNFRGIEKSEYPSGKRFSVEDFRGPDLLAKALSDAAIAPEIISVKDLAAHVNITPAIPAEIQNRWRKQDKDGTKREEYYPNEFSVSIELGEIAKPQGRRLFDALISRYQERVKYDQKSALAFVAAWDSSYDKLANSYDYWDIPQLFRENHYLLIANLTSLIAESLQYQDAKYQLLFREIGRDLETWDRTRLQALEAVTYQGQLVRNRDVIMQRIQYRLQELDIQIRQKSQEATEAMRLLEVIDRPMALLAGQTSTRDGLPMVDANVIEKLIKSDYVGPVVQRISALQERTQLMEAEKARLQKQLNWLPKSLHGEQPPPSYKELINTLSSELTTIIQNYNRIVDDYLSATISNLVLVKQSPVFVRNVYSLTLAIPMIAFISFLLALLFIGVGRLFERAREEKQPPTHRGSES